MSKPLIDSVTPRVRVTIKLMGRGYYRILINGTSIGGRATSFYEAQQRCIKIVGIAPAQPENAILDPRRSRPRHLPYLELGAKL